MSKRVADEDVCAVPLVRPLGAAAGEHPMRYTIATLVNDLAQYDAMRASFMAGGFGPADCEYLYIDNTGPAQTCAYRGLDAALAAARGQHVILCHQDVRLLADGREELDLRLAELNRLDPSWALAGNAGGVRPGVLAIRITDPHGANQRIGTFPERVATLDENFIVVRRASRVGFSRELTGFHLYGADICLMAEVAGHAAYVIDFHLVHLSGGVKSPAFYEARERFREKWRRVLSPRWIQTTCTLIRLSRHPGGHFAARLAEAPYAKLSRRMSRARGWS